MGATVLLVEDGRQDRELIGKVLRQDGYEVLEASDGAIALEILRTFGCDLVITDFVMPKLNGIKFKFVEQLHTLQPRLPIILITSYLSAMSGATILNEVAEILAKPFDLNLLRSTVRRLLDTPHATN